MDKDHPSPACKKPTATVRLDNRLLNAANMLLPGVAMDTYVILKQGQRAGFAQ